MSAVGRANFIFRSERMVLPLWRSLHALNLMLPKEDRRAMLLRLYNEDTPLMDHSKERFHNSNNNNNRSKPQPHVKMGDEPEDIKDEEAEDVKDEMAVEEEDEEGNVAAAGLGEDVENGAKDGEADDDLLPDALKEEVEDAV